MGKKTRNKFKNTVTAGKQVSGLYVDPSISKCKPITKGAEHIIFGAPGTTDADVHAFMTKIKVLAKKLVREFKKNGATVSNALGTLEEPTFVVPDDLAADVPAVLQKKRSMEQERVLQAEMSYEDNVQKLFWILRDHCTEVLIAELEKHEDYKSIGETMNGVKLANLIKKLYMSGGSKQVSQSNVRTCAQALLDMAARPQTKEQGNQDFVQGVVAAFDVRESLGEKVGYFEGEIDRVLKEKMAAEGLFTDVDASFHDEAELKQIESLKEKAIAEVREEYIVFVALKLADPSRFHGLRKSLEMQDLVGTSTWPKTQAALVVLLDDWERLHPPRQLQPRPGDKPGNDKEEETPATVPKVEGDDKKEESGPSFMQSGEGVRTNSKGETHCHNCGEEGHWKDKCPKAASGMQGMQQGAASDSEGSDGDVWVSEGVQFSQRGKEDESANGAKVYFDSCTVKSTVDTKALSGVRDAPNAFSVLCNAGTMTLTKCGQLGDLPVMARDSGIANLISIPELEVFFKDHGGELTYSSSAGWALTMNGETISVPTEPSGPCKGMPYLLIEDARKIFTVDKDVWSRVNVESRGERKLKIQDVKNAYRQLPVSILKNRCGDSPDDGPSPPKPSPKTSAVEIKWQLPKKKGGTKGRIVVSGNSHVQASIRGNMEGLSKKQAIGASDARLKQSCMAATPSGKMLDLVRNNRLKKCSVTLADLHNANFVFGPKARANLRGGTTREKPDKVEVGKVEIPMDFYKLHRFVTLSADVMFCNGLPFMTTVSHDIDFMTAEFLARRTAEHLSKTLTKVLQLYGKNGFVVRLVHMDNEFACLQEMMPLIEIELTAAGEHVTKIERCHRTIKERARGVLAELLYSY